MGLSIKNADSSALISEIQIIVFEGEVLAVFIVTSHTLRSTAFSDACELLLQTPGPPKAAVGRD